VRQTRKLIVINKESYHFTVSRSGFLINPFRFVSNIAQGLGACVQYDLPPDHRSGRPTPIGQANPHLWRQPTGRTTHRSRGHTKTWISR